MATFSLNIFFFTDAFFYQTLKSNRDFLLPKPIKTNKVLLQTENKHFQKCILYIFPRLAELFSLLSAPHSNRLCYGLYMNFVSFLTNFSAV